MNNIKAIFIKQFQSMLKNPVLLGQAILYLIIVVILTFFIGGPPDDCYSCIPAYVCEQCLEDNPPLDTPNPSLTGLFTVMFVGLALVGAASALVIEDKTTQNLRFMSMARVKPGQYMLGTTSAMFVLIFIILILYALSGRYFGVDMLWFMAITMSGAIVSILLGIVMALSKAPALTTPISLFLGMGPMLSTFNETLARALYFTYTQQINLAVSDLNEDLSRNFMIIGINGALILLLFVLMYRKGVLE